MQLFNMKKSQSGNNSSVSTIALLMAILLLTILFFVVSCQDPYSTEMSDHSFHEYDAPNVANTAAAADNVYIGELISIAEDTYTKKWSVETQEFSLELRKINVRVEQVLKGNYAKGEIITDEVPESYICFAEDIGKSFVFCTGFDVVENVRTRYYSPLSDSIETIWLMDVGFDSVFTGWRLTDNPFIMIRINDDGTITQGNATTVIYGGTELLQPAYSVNKGEPFAPNPMLNEDVNGSVIQSLMLELSNTDRLAKKIAKIVNSDVTEIRMINAPWNEFYNVSEETEKEFVDSLLNKKEGYWVNNGDKTYSFSEDMSDGAVKTEIHSVSDVEKIKEWQSKALKGYKDCVLSNIHTKMPYRGVPNSNPQKVSKYIAFYSGDEMIAVFGCYEYEDAKSMGNAVSECYGLYDAQTGDYAFYTNSTGNLDVGSLIDMLEE